MNLTIFTMFIVVVLSKNWKIKRGYTKTSKVGMIITSILFVFLLAFITVVYFKASTTLDAFHLIEKVHEEKGISIYTIMEEEQEKYIILKSDGIFNKVFLQTKGPVAESFFVETKTFKYTHRIEIENAVITHTYKKRWGDTLLSFWLILAMALYNVKDIKELSKPDKIIGSLWLAITVGVTIFFLF